MKQLKTLLFVVALSIGTLTFAQAQSKVAHIDTQELIAAMPATKIAETELQKLGETYQADLQSTMTEYQNKAKQYADEEPTKTQEENVKRMEELQVMQQSIQKFEQEAQQNMQKKQMELLKPIQEKAIAAINKVAKAQGFNYVLDKQALIVADGKDILADVKKELGL